MLEVTLVCKGSKRLPIVCMSHWEGDGGWGVGFFQNDFSLTASSISDCLDGQLSLCVSLNSLVQERQTVCLRQRALLHS